MKTRSSPIRIPGLPPRPYALLSNKCRTKNTGTSNSKRTKRHSSWGRMEGRHHGTCRSGNPKSPQRTVQPYPYNYVVCTAIRCEAPDEHCRHADTTRFTTRQHSPTHNHSTEPRSLRLDVHMRPRVLTRLQRSPQQRCHDDYRPLLLTFQPRTGHDLQDIFRDIRSCHLEAAQDSADQFAALPLFSRHYAETTTFPCLKLSVATDSSTLHTRYNMTNPNGLCGLNIVFQA